MNLLEGLSHELRAPLQTLLGHVDLMRRGTFGELTAEQADALDAVAGSAEKILRVANDVLQVARIDSGLEKVRAEEVALDALLERELEDVRAQADAKGLRLELDCPPGLSVVSDEAKLGRILTNLLSNAVKYTEAGSVRVSARKDRIEVIDTGVGIGAGDREAVFEEYVRLDTKQDGTGLGLAIVRRLAGLLGARLELESEPGRGTTVRLHLP